MKDWERKNQNEYKRPQSISDEKQRARELAEKRQKWLAGENYVYDAPRKAGNFTSADKERPIVSENNRSQPKTTQKPAQKATQKKKTKKNKKAKVDNRSKDERRMAYAKDARKRRKRNVIKALIFTVIIAVGLLVALSLTVLFKIETVTVSGDTRYKSELVIENSGVKIGDNLWRTTSKKVTQKMSQSLPYVLSVEVVRKIPSEVELVITETVAVYSIKKGGKYILIDENDKVLEDSASKKGDTVELVGIEVLNTKPGTTLTVKSPESFETAKEIISEATSSQMKLTNVDVTDTNLLTAVYGGKIRFEFGSRSDMASKLKMAKEIVTKLESENNQQEGVINLKSVTKAFFKEEMINTTAASKENKKATTSKTVAADDDTTGTTQKSEE